MIKRVWLVVKTEQIISDGVPTGEYMPDEYEGVFETREEAFECTQQSAEAYLGNADYVSELSGGFGFYAELRIDDEYVFWKSYKIEPVNSYL
ncbi:hypothetical protein J6A32_07340 [Methanocorpusculum sp.]|nr:hypothetical protein [Methanocorpusculum sp.]